jgi:mannose-6-phosphate isomerase
VQVWRLTNEVRDYAWGSRTHISRLHGLPDADRPMAEQWFGAHAGAPSRIDDGRTLAAVIAADPQHTLGSDVAEHFDGRLPFLLKLLAAAEPLSLQVHPTTARARAGFREEDALGKPVDAADRNYRDPSHKPELIYALTRFEGMAGFRDLARTADILRLLQLPWLDDVAERLDSSPAPFQTLRSVVGDWLTLERDELTALVGELGKAAAAAEERAHKVDPRARPPLSDRQSVERESLRVFAQTASLAAAYPNDAGVLVTLLLNHVVLAPGEAMFLDAGVIHAYTFGFGVEIMASSDNVVRAGLTPKHVDIPELMRITDFRPMPAPLWTPHDETPGVAVFQPPVEDFRLEIAELPAAVAPADGPRIVLVLEGRAVVSTALDQRGALDRPAGRLALAQGESVFVPDADGPIEITGTGRVAIASVPA